MTCSPNHLHCALEIALTNGLIVILGYADPRDPESGLPKTEPRGIYTNPVKKGQLPNNYLDGSFLMAIKGQEADPFVDPTKLKMGLVTAQGVSIAKGKKEKAAAGDESKPFYPAVNKWNMYTSKETAEKRLGAPYPYIEHKEHANKKPLPKDDKGKLT